MHLQCDVIKYRENSFEFLGKGGILSLILIFYIFLYAPLSVTETTLSPDAGVTPTVLPTYSEVEVPATESCRPLNPGESIIVNDANADVAPGGVPRRYRLTRLPGDSTFRVDVNINLIPMVSLAVQELNSRNTVRPPNDLIRDPDETGIGAITDEVRARFYARANECVRRYGDRLRSPDGTRLQLNIIRDTSGATAPVNDVEIAPGDGRSSSVEWMENINCGTIIHEVLHLLGLCDGYGESRTTTPNVVQRLFGREEQVTNRYPCRAIEAPESIMNDSALASGESLPLLFCRAIVNTPEAARPPRILQVPRLPLSCPSTHEHDSVYTSFKRSSMLRARSAEYNGVIFYIQENPTSNYALLNAHTRLITQPLCISANRRYLTCSSYSRFYNLSSCPRLPPYCRDGTHTD